MSAVFSTVPEMVTVCLIYKDSITLMSTQCVTWAGFMSLWISVEKYNVRQYKYCSCLLYHIVCFIGQVTCAVVVLVYFFFFFVCLFFYLSCFGLGFFCCCCCCFFFLVWLVFCVFFPPVLIRKHYSGNSGRENSFPLYFAIGELNEFEICK